MRALARAFMSTSSTASSYLAWVRAKPSYQWLTRTARAAKAKTVLPEHQSPSEEFLLEYVVALTVTATLAILLFKMLATKGREGVLRACGVSIRKLARSVREIQRKGFHVAGLLVPLIQLLLLRNGYTNSDCTKICWTITIVGTSMDWLRLNSKLVADHWPLRSILREHEHKQLTGGCYFALGCTLSICKWRARAQICFLLTRTVQSPASCMPMLGHPTTT